MRCSSSRRSVSSSSAMRVWVGSPGIFSTRKCRSATLARLGHELSLAETDARELPRHFLREPRRRLRARSAQLRGEAPHLLLRRAERCRGGGDRVEAVVDRAQLRLRLDRKCEELLVRAGTEAPFRVRDPVELRLDLLEPAGLGLEARQEPT